MKILYEKSLVYGESFFADIGDCQSFDTHHLQPQQLQGVDALLVRSTTRVDETLLKHADKLAFVATGTAGFDHLDVPLLESRGIKVHTAAGCNAVAVAEYVLSCLFVARLKFGLDLPQKTVGIVGAGNVGTALSRLLDALQINYKLCDPLLAKAGDERLFSPLNEVLDCDIISLHVPWTREGEHPTHHLIDSAVIEQLKPEQVLVNACRGEVIDETALLQRLIHGDGPQVFLDVWQNEPDINTDLMPFVHVATPHIAGHSLEGKARGTEYVYQGLTKHFDLSCDKSLYQFVPTPQVTRVEVSDNVLSLDTIQRLVFMQYDIRDDDLTFRKNSEQGITFSYQRKHYRVRREFAALTVHCHSCDVAKVLAELGFTATTK